MLWQTMNFTPPPVPYWFQTPKGSDIDLRLFNRGQLSSILLVMLYAACRSWHSIKL